MPINLSTEDKLNKDYINHNHMIFVSTSVFARETGLSKELINRNCLLAYKEKRGSIYNSLGAEFERFVFYDQTRGKWWVRIDLNDHYEIPLAGKGGSIKGGVVPVNCIRWPKVHP